MSTLNVADFEVETVPNRTAGKQAARDTTKSRSLGLGLLAPVLVFFAILNVIPTLWMIGLGFFDYTLGGGDPEFVGFDNFVLIYESAEQWATFTRTLFFMVVAVSIEVALGVVLGFRFWGIARMPGRRVALTMLFTPMVVAPVASGLFWKLMYEPTFGVINYLVDLFGGKKIDFLTDVHWVTPAVLVVDIWMWTPFMILIMLAALGSVPRAELEAAEIDRMPWLKRLRYVILPNAKFILMLGILLRTIDSFKTLDLVYLMTQG
ncbi:MAG: carbohydrate ABC transporter permease, partial [Aeromicrobium sp.]